MLESRNILLVPLDVDDISDEYVAWLNDPETFRYLDTKFGQTRSSIRRYIESFSPPNLLCKIIMKEGQRHVGNINLHGYHPIHRFISLGIMIGEASARGRGIGKETCSLVIQHAFDHLNIHKVIAGTVVENVGMTKVFTQLGFTIEGTFVQHYYLEGRYHDTYRFGLLRENFVPHHKSVP